MARNISGFWRIDQGNNDSVVNVSEFNPSTGNFNIHAMQLSNGVQGAGGGNVDGEFVSFVINWQNGTRGAYNGTFDGQGRINGASFDIMNPGSTAAWSSDRTF
jgi:hypothetical protein